MNELYAKQIAAALSGEPWQSGGGIRLVCNSYDYARNIHEKNNDLCWINQI